MNSSAVPVIAVDGPGGAGKGTVCRRLARQLGWHYLDSGMLYRLLAMATINHHIEVDNESAIKVMASALDVSFERRGEGDDYRAVLEGEDVSDGLRSEEIGMIASQVASLPSVRAALLARQRAFAELPGLVADGRDMGTVVFPEAAVKIFLTATVEERAKRRHKQLLEQGQNDSLARLVEAIAARDKADMTRPVAPLVPASDSLQIDSTPLSVDQVCELILERAREVGLIDR